jgi:DNA-binding CsgD family transcriptional regulator
MSTTASLDAHDLQSIWKLAGACRTLGYDPNAWRRHLLTQLSRLVCFDAGFCGAMADCVSIQPGTPPIAGQSVDLFFERLTRQENLSTTPGEIACFRAIRSDRLGDRSGLVLRREGQRPGFSTRDHAVVCEVHALLAPLIGGPLAHFAEASPLDLPQRVQDVLRCLLEGAGDKQIAARLALSRFTVNQYNKHIYRHFGVESRPELLARWIRRGMSPFLSCL